MKFKHALFGFLAVSLLWVGIGLSSARAYQITLLEAVRDTAVSALKDSGQSTVGAMQPLNLAPTRRTTTVGTTPIELIATDLAANEQVAKLGQYIVVTNRHGTQDVCVGEVAWSAAGADCNDKCAAASGTCTKASTDWSPVVAGTSREFTPDGTWCVCIVGSAASTDFTAERVVR